MNNKTKNTIVLNQKRRYFISSVGGMMGLGPQSVFCFYRDYRRNGPKILRGLEQNNIFLAIKSEFGKRGLKKVVSKVITISMNYK